MMEGTRSAAAVLIYERICVVEVVAVSTADTLAAQPDARPGRGLQESLLPDTRAWLAHLPEDRRPYELAQAFPRIANRLCGLWDNPALCDRYLRSLLLDTRDGARQGFPPAVVLELGALLGAGEPAAERAWSRIGLR